MNYILKKALEMAAVLRKSERLFLFNPNRIRHLLGRLSFSFTRLGIWRRRRIDG
ncbi:MAG: hypothetical protein ACLU9X_10460 [Alistipes shahii]